jgi:4-amino-4-deoxy-L-arabinose transferase-like glycosyltransferase
MARRRTKSSHPSQPAARTAPHKVLPAGLPVSILVTVVMGGIPFALGRYVEFKSPDPFDSGAYVYSAQHLLAGARLGIDEVPSANPVTLLANVMGVKLFGFSETGPKIIQTALQVIALAFMFYTLRKIFGSIAAVVGTTVAAIYLSAPLIAKFGNVKEQYMIAFAICAACCFLLHEDTRKHGWLALCGFFAVLPYYCKPTGVAVVAAIIVYLLISRSVRRQWKNLLTDILLFLGGIAVGLTVPASLFIWQKRLDMFRYTFPVIALQVVVGFLAVLVPFCCGIYYFRKIHLWNQLRQVRRFIWLSGLAVLLLAFIFSIIAVAAANRHYTNAYAYSTVTVSGDLADYLSSIPIIAIPVKIHGVIDSSINRLIGAAGLKGGYVEYSWKAITFSKLAPQILRYYKALCVPILLAFLSLITALILKIKKSSIDNRQSPLWMLSLWWLMDMALVWVSPHSYEQYYLPLCASAAMLTGFAVWKWQQKLASAVNKWPWLMMGAVAAVVLASLSVPIFIGQRYSPDTGADYIKNYGSRRRGFAQALDGIKSDQKFPWQLVGDYIRTHSTQQDTIYVWGWVPGIYVRAQRLAPIPKAFEGDMHTMPPQQLAGLVVGMVRHFEKNPPKFIVDTRKRHFPFNRPPLELWPIVPEKMLGNDRPRLLNPAKPDEITAFDTAYKQFLNDKIEPDEALRYAAMKPLRDYVTTHYRFAGQYGDHVLFERIQTSSVQNQ